MPRIHKRPIMHAPRHKSLTLSVTSGLTKYYKSYPYVREFILYSKMLSLSKSQKDNLNKMPVHRFYLYLINSICLLLVYCHQLSPIENELRDLMTQDSVIMRAGIAIVIKDFRDGAIATIEWPSLIKTAFELDRV
jgi:hypothetical protein